MARKRLQVVNPQITNVVDESEVRITEEENNQSALYNPDVLVHAAENLLWPERYTETQKEILDELRRCNINALLTAQEARALFLFVVKKKSLAQIRDAMGLSRQRIAAMLKNVGKKLRRYLDID